MDLYLVRHAVAFKRDAGRWPDDGERPLTPEGARDFRLAARGLGGLAPEVEALLSSPLARAWQTAEILGEETPWPAPVRLPELEPDLPPHKAVGALERYAERHAELNSVALVGHRPNIHELGSYLLTGDAEGLRLKIKKGGVACLRFDGIPRPGTGTLRWLLMPKNLCSQAGAATPPAS